jgi:tRNA-binding protein
MIDFEQFMAVKMHVGTILTAVHFPAARKPAYQLSIDFGTEIGIKRSSAQITVLYSPESLIGQQIIAVTNFPPKRIAGFVSEVLVLGAYNETGAVVLLQPQQALPNGSLIA